jgi:hypothetical protein
MRCLHGGLCTATATIRTTNLNDVSFSEACFCLFSLVNYGIDFHRLIDCAIILHLDPSVRFIESNRHFSIFESQARWSLASFFSQLMVAGTTFRSGG